MSPLKTTSHGYDLESVFPWLRGKSKTTFRLHPRAADSLPPHGSKIGGDILWPADEPWPQCEEHNSDYVPVLQLHSADVPGFHFMPHTDLLQILWCPNDHAEGGCCPALRVYWRDSTSLSRVDCTKLQIRAQHKDYVPRQCRLHPEAVQEYPSAFELSDDQTKELERWKEDGCSLYQYSLSVAPGFKVGGYPHWVQESEVPSCCCGRQMDYLLTIDSAEFDGGTFERWLPESEQHVWGEGYEARSKVQSAAGLMLGDMGNINVFVCRDCIPWKHQWVFQCS